MCLDSIADQLKGVGFLETGAFEAPAPKKPARKAAAKKRRASPPRVKNAAVAAPVAAETPAEATPLPPIRQQNWEPTALNERTVAWHGAVRFTIPANSRRKEIAQGLFRIAVRLGQDVSLLVIGGPELERINLDKPYTLSGMLTVRRDGRDANTASSVRLDVCDCAPELELVLERKELAGRLPEGAIWCKPFERRSLLMRRLPARMQQKAAA